MVKAIICDIDGTLAHMSGRSPYDPTRYHEDVVDPVIREIVGRYRKDGFLIIVCSGRHNTHMDATAKWLEANEILFDKLLMRREGDMRSDAVVKQEIYEENIMGKYDIHFVLDDRNRVVKMWRDQGLKVLQVAEGDF